MSERTPPPAACCGRSRRRERRGHRGGGGGRRCAEHSQGHGGNQDGEAGLAEGQAIESTYFGLCFATRDQDEGMAAFLEKRQAEWKGC